MQVASSEQSVDRSIRAKSDPDCNWLPYKNDLCVLISGYVTLLAGCEEEVSSIAQIQALLRYRASGCAKPLRLESRVGSSGRADSARELTTRSILEQTAGGLCQKASRFDLPVWSRRLSTGVQSSTAFTNCDVCPVDTLRYRSAPNTGARRPPACCTRPRFKTSCCWHPQNYPER